VPYQDEKLMELPERCSKHRPVLALGLYDALHAGVLYRCISRARILFWKALRFIYRRWYIAEGYIWVVDIDLEQFFDPAS
jgi:hypothetical protein